jgi:hypothetical protein
MSVQACRGDVCHYPYYFKRSSPRACAVCIHNDSRHVTVKCLIAERTLNFECGYYPLCVSLSSFVAYFCVLRSLNLPQRSRLFKWTSRYVIVQVMTRTAGLL